LAATRSRKPEDPVDAADRPTLPPPFEPAEFARESERELATAKEAKPDPSGVRVAKLRLRSRPVSVLMLDSDVVGRSAVVRSLLRAECSVTAAGSVDALDEALAGGERFDVVLVSPGTRDLGALMQTILAVQPEVPVIALSTDEAQTRATMGGAGVDDFILCRREASTADLIAALKALLING
jgi:CheY-like chemotaxis protein